MPLIELRLLGALQVRVDGVERGIAARKHRALVAGLALRRGSRTREQVIADLWPESDEERGRQNLRHALYRIRAALGADLIAAAGDALRLADGVGVDVWEFEHAIASGADDDLAHALELYTGDLATEVEGVEGEGERVRLRGLVAAAGETLAARRLAADAREALAIARRVIEIDPYREEAHRLLLRALAATGDLAGAAIHYRRLASLLRDELGVEPSSDTRQLYASLGRVAPSPTGARIRQPSLEPPPELIGRRAEYGRVMAAVTDAIDGRGGSALLVGEGGAGKSRLLEEITAVAEEHGLRVLRARATAAEGALPFQLWIDALTPVGAEAAALAEPWPAVLATLLPETARTGVGQVAPELRRTRLFEGVARLLAHVSAIAPAVVAIDDLHHADPDSVHLFHYIARTSRGRRIALLAAAREAAPGSALAAARASLEPRGELGIVPVGPLAPDAVGELVRRFGVHPETAAWLAPRLAAWTGGNPFFVLEVLRALLGQERLRRVGADWRWAGERPDHSEPLSPELPPTVRQTILSRVAALPDPTRRLLDVVAVLGPSVRVEVVAALTGRDDLSVAQDLAPALEAGLLREAREASATIAFAHELVRDATYQRLPTTVRSAMHRRAAAALEGLGGTSGAIAFHLTAGGEAARGAERWIENAREAEATFAHDDAIRSWRAALDAVGPLSPRRAEILTGIGDAHVRRGSTAEGVAAYEDALAALGPDRDGERAALSTRIASATRYYHRHPRALELAVSAVGHYRRAGDGERLAESLVALAFAEYADGDAPAALAAAEEAGALGRELGASRTEVQALHVASWARWLAGEIWARPDEDDVERLAKALGDDESLAYLISMVSTALSRLGSPGEALAHSRRALEMARRVGSLRAQIEAGEQLTAVLRYTGAWPEAVNVAEEVRAETAGLELSAPPRLLGELTVALALAGQGDRALALAEEIIGARSAGPPVHASPVLDAIAALMTLGRPPDGALIEGQRPSCGSCLVWWTAVAGRHAALAGSAERALELAAGLESLPRDSRVWWYGGLAEHIRALALARTGHASPAALATKRARESFRSAGRADLEAILDRDLTTISRIHA